MAVQARQPVIKQAVDIEEDVLVFTLDEERALDEANGCKVGLGVDAIHDV